MKINVINNVTKTVRVIAAGPQGPRGDPGDFTLAELLAASQETFTQTEPAEVWNVTHSLGGRPAVTVVDSAESVCYGDVTYISDSAITITFSAPFSGACYLS